MTACWAMESRENDCRRGSGLCPISQSDQRSKRSEAGARSRGLPSPEARAQASARGARSVAALVDAPSVAPDEIELLTHEEARASHCRRRSHQ